MKTNTTTTTSRIYWTEENDGIWSAYFQPLNPKTGLPWQAYRILRKGWTVWRGYNWKKQTKGEIQTGTPPEFDIWVKEWTSIGAGFRSEGEALAAISAEMAKSGK